MEKLADVRSRMRSVSGIGEVCRTLATVASAKLAQTHERARGAREYTAALRSILMRQQGAALADGLDPAAVSPLMVARPAVRTVSVLVIGADRGLCATTLLWGGLLGSSCSREKKRTSKCRSS
jgi:F0F1-type ATP synthase gamma subunit